MAENNPRLEALILAHLFVNDVFAKTSLPHMVEDYFFDKSEKYIFQHLKTFIEKYHSQPTTEAISIELSNRNDLTEDEYKNSIQKLKELKVDKIKVNDKITEWLVDQSEKFCKEKALHNALSKSIHIMDDKKESPHRIPEILKDALAVSFNVEVGHNYFRNIEERYKYYHKKEDKVPFDLDFFNKITKGGLSPKTLNICLAGTYVGKSLFLCHCAANYISQNKNVLYITLEMAEEEIARRIDCNLLNVPSDDIENLPHDLYVNKLNEIKKKTTGQLVIHEYPTSSAHVGHFQILVDELRMKENFNPDVIIVDYINICASVRNNNPAGQGGSYMYVKHIAEELRGLAVVNKAPVLTATQTNREGFDNTDFGLQQTGESWGVPQTADLMFGLIRTEELDEANQLLVKQMKNRYTNAAKNKKFIIGVDINKFKLFDVAHAAQKNISGANQTNQPKEEKKFQGLKI